MTLSSMLAVSRRATAPRAAGIAALAITWLLAGCTGSAAVSPSSAPSAALGGSAVPAASTPMPTKAAATFPATPAPISSAAPCHSGGVIGTLGGWGPAGGTMYVLIRVKSTASDCSLPGRPSVTIRDAAGAARSSATAPDTASASRIDVGPSGVGVRVAMVSWCEAAPPDTLDVSLDPVVGVSVSVKLPSGFAVPCSGPTEILVDPLVES